MTADLSAPEARERIDITAMAIPDQSFDVIICSHVLEHVVGDRDAMKEMLRVLKPGGCAYVQIPYVGSRPTDEDPGLIDPKERERRFGQFDHVRIYGCDFEDRLINAGFVVAKMQGATIATEDQMAKYGLWDDIIWICKRPISEMN
jgi:SAM-dependent methyltransferase